MHPVLERNFEAFSAADWPAAFAAHIPNAGEHLLRYYGWYSHVNREKRRKTPGMAEGPLPAEDDSEVAHSVAARAWVRLSK